MKTITFSDYRSRLDDAIAAIKSVRVTYPIETVFVSIQSQLEQLRAWTSNGNAPTLEQKGELNFGLLASRYLDPIEPELSNELYELADFVLYWT